MDQPLKVKYFSFIDKLLGSLVVVWLGILVLGLTALNVFFGFRFGFNYPLWHGTALGELTQAILGNSQSLYTLTPQGMVLILLIGASLLAVPVFSLPIRYSPTKSEQVVGLLVGIAAPSALGILAVPGFFLPMNWAVLLSGITTVMAYAYVLGKHLTVKGREGDPIPGRFLAIFIIWVISGLQLFIVDWANMFVIGST